MFFSVTLISCKKKTQNPRFFYSSLFFFLILNSIIIDSNKYDKKNFITYFNGNNNNKLPEQEKYKVWSFKQTNSLNYDFKIIPKKKKRT